MEEVSIRSVSYSSVLQIQSFTTQLMKHCKHKNFQNSHMLILCSELVPWQCLGMDLLYSGGLLTKRRDSVGNCWI